MLRRVNTGLNGRGGSERGGVGSYRERLRKNRRLGAAVGVGGHLKEKGRGGTQSRSNTFLLPKYK